MPERTHTKRDTSESTWEPADPAVASALGEVVMQMGCDCPDDPRARAKRRNRCSRCRALDTLVAALMAQEDRQSRQARRSSTGAQARGLAGVPRAHEVHCPVCRAYICQCTSGPSPYAAFNAWFEQVKGPLSRETLQSMRCDYLHALAMVDHEMAERWDPAGRGLGVITRPGEHGNG